MKLLKALPLDKSQVNSGFTLLEIMIGIGMLAIIFSLGLVLSMDFYKGYALNYEQNLLVSFLQKARSQSMANINQAAHGIHYGTTSVDCGTGINVPCYILFEGTSYVQGASKNQSIPRGSNNISVSGLTNVVFEQISGKIPGGKTITISDSSKTKTITINDEGAILY